MEKNTINYSIIIPHYNIPDLLMRCLHSIPLRDDIQVIVVDDCSPEADTYMSRFPELSRPNFEFYSTTKGGSAGRARNVGLDHAKGKWLIFADADDFFTNNIQDILDECIDYKEDIIYFNFKCVSSDDVSQPSKHRHGSHYKEYFNDSTGNEEKFRLDFPSPWAKIIKKQLVDDNHIKFDETRWSNDVFFITSVGIKANRIKVINKDLYVLTERNDSLTHVFCQNIEELKVRTDVAFRTQKIISESSYRHFNIISFYLRLLFIRNKKLFNIYFRRAKTLGFNTFELIRNIGTGRGRRFQLRLFFYILTHHL